MFTESPVLVERAKRNDSNVIRERQMKITAIRVSDGKVWTCVWCNRPSFDLVLLPTGRGSNATTCYECLREIAIRSDPMGDYEDPYAKIEFEDEGTTG